MKNFAITAGLYAMDFYRNDATPVPLDLGTNGKIATGNRSRLSVTSMEADPAFEGGNIVCGSGSVPGAICSVEIHDNGIIIDLLLLFVSTGIL